MTAPMDPNNFEVGSSEFSWGRGLFPPGIANNEGQRGYQDDFGVVAGVPMTGSAGDAKDNYARAVADRRTDPTDPTSGRDFSTEGLVDRYGPQPPLVREDPQSARMSREARALHNRKPQKSKRGR